MGDCTCHLAGGNSPWCSIHGRAATTIAEAAAFDIRRESEAGMAWDAIAPIIRSAIEPYLGALSMIARHPCHVSNETRPDWHCGECASCIARDALNGEG